MAKQRQADIIDRLVDLMREEHANGCEDNTCDINAAIEGGCGLWAIELFHGCGAASERFDELYAKLGKGFRAKAEAERKILCESAHFDCKHCNAVIWAHEEDAGQCDSCGQSTEEKPEPPKPQPLEYREHLTVYEGGGESTYVTRALKEFKLIHGGAA